MGRRTRVHRTGEGIPGGGVRERILARAQRCGSDRNRHGRGVMRYTATRVRQGAVASAAGAKEVLVRILRIKARLVTTGGGGVCCRFERWLFAGPGTVLPKCGLEECYRQRYGGKRPVPHPAANTGQRHDTGSYFRAVSRPLDDGPLVARFTLSRAASRTRSVGLGQIFIRRRNAGLRWLRQLLSSHRRQYACNCRTAGHAHLAREDRRSTARCRLFSF